MKFNSPLLALTVWLVALVAGFAGKRWLDPSEEGRSSESGGTLSDHRRIGDDEEVAAEKGDEVLATKLLDSAKLTRSTDDLETILQIDPVAEYGRLALWMVDATEPEIAAYWQDYRRRENRSNDITDLIFINWTRLDPQSAISTAAGSDDEHYAWWAWACHEPQKAWAAAKSSNPDRMNNVAWALGEFHGEWLMAHFEEIPEENRGMALRGLTKWDDVADPGAILDFLEETDSGFNPAIFKALVIKDPWAAYDRVVNAGENGGGLEGMGRNSANLLIQSLAEVHPDLLERMVELTPPGALRRRMEAQAFEGLLESDLERAANQALETKGVGIAAGMLAKVGSKLVNSDPERAFEMAEKIFGMGPDGILQRSVIESENGKRIQSGSRGEVRSMIQALVSVNPDRVMSLAVGNAGDSVVQTEAIRSVGTAWAQEDLAGYSEWVASQDEFPQRSAAVGPLIDQLEELKMYPEVLAWCASDPRYENRIGSRLQRWAEIEPESARSWLDAADLPEEKRNEFLQQLDSNER